MTNEEMVIEYLKEQGSITSWEAFQHLFVTRLSAIIYNLKKQGYSFSDVREQHTNKYGKTKTFKRYYLRSSNNG